MQYNVDLVITSSVAVTHAPTKTAYNVGETFDPTGLVVTATYADGTTEDVTDGCTFSPTVMAASTTAVTDQIPAGGRDGHDHPGGHGPGNVQHFRENRTQQNRVLHR